jgi:tetratricopeptide (TPR) repeat protein
MRVALSLAVVLLTTTPTSSSAVPDAPQWLIGPICHGEPPPSIAGPHRLVMLPGMGDDHMAADTRSPEAQRWFDYGLTLARSFEHGDAVLAFQRAEAADPSCSLCVWGEAWAAGPNINFGPGPEATAHLLALARKAQALAAPGAPAPIPALEAALVDRYGGEKGDLAYARDLDALQKARPDDVEVAVSDAEAWLILEREGDPSGPTRALQVLEPLVASHPDVSGLVHFYVHATEDAGVPERAASYAARLAELAPSASHMVHMPSHTWFRIGRYEDAARANLAALKVDLAYAQRTDFPTPLGRLTYHFHDIAFGLAGAVMAGDQAVAQDMIRQFNSDFPAPATYDSQAESGAAAVLAAVGRVEPPATVLAAPDAVASRPYLEALRHYARGEADLRLGRLDDAQAEAAQVILPPSFVTSPGSARPVVVQIAQLTLQGETALRAGKPAQAADAFAKAADLQDRRLARDVDPPVWAWPVRRELAGALLAKGDATGAAREATAALAVWKLDPLSLAVRAQAERALGQPDAAAKDQDAARGGWRGPSSALKAVTAA